MGRYFSCLHSFDGLVNVGFNFILFYFIFLVFMMISDLSISVVQITKMMIVGTTLSFIEKWFRGRETVDFCCMWDDVCQKNCLFLA